MRYYVHRVEYNKTAQAENRVIKGYDDENEAKAAFHEYMRDDITNPEISRANVLISNEMGVINPRYNEYWEEPKPAPTPSV